MTKIQALRGSIKKWKRILLGEVRDFGPRNCDLCKMYFYQENTCDGCPVYERIGLAECSSTPHEKWHAHQCYSHDNPEILIISCAECAGIAWDEVQFLKSLLPKRKKK